MNDNMNKTSICSIVALEIIDFSKKTETDQLEIKNQLNSLIDHAVIDIPQADRVIVEKEHGAMIVFNGASEDALEDALFISLTVRDEILKNNTQSLKPWYVQFGIHLGNVKVAAKKGQQDVIGEGVDEARRIMSFANPNQILASRAYHDMASKLTQEVSNMFEQYDMHVHEQDIYSVRLNKESAMTFESDVVPAEELRSANWQSMAGKINWKYAGIGLLAFVVIVGLGKQLFAPSVPMITMDEPVIAQSSSKSEEKASAEPVAIVEPLPATESNSMAKQEPKKKTKVAQKKPAPVVEAKATASQAQEPAAKTHESKASASTPVKTSEAKTEKDTAHDKSSWESIKDSVAKGTQHPCSQAETALGQCTK